MESDKRKFVEQVVDLIVMSRNRSTASDLNGPNLEMTQKLRSKLREEEIALHMKHYESEHLVALLDFYNTEMGESILSAQIRMSHDMSSGLKFTGQ